MIQFYFLGGTVGFDIAFHPQIIKITFKPKFKYFKNDFTGILPLGGGEQRGVEHMVQVTGEQTVRLQGFVWRTCREIVFFSQYQMSYRSDLRRERVKELTARRAKWAPSARGIYDYILSTVFFCRFMPQAMSRSSTQLYLCPNQLSTFC